MALTDEVKATIQDGYRTFLKQRELKPRFGQRQMIAEIAGFLGRLETEISAPKVCAVEAGTGTGKTLAYLLSVLPLAKAQGKKVVLATGTVALQGQLIDRDIPDLMAATGWEESFALAKGRGRYLCPLRLEQCESSVNAVESGQFLFEDEMPFVGGRGDSRLIAKLGEAWRDESWEGDRDRWPDTIPDTLWRALTIDGRQCSGHRCRLISECCFYRARAKVEDADCIVANHDLVMADLALGGGVVLPSPEDTIYVFDEAHRLADTALNHFGAQCAIEATGSWLGRLQAHGDRAGTMFAESPELVEQAEALGELAVEAIQLNQQVAPILEACFDMENTGQSDKYASATERHRFPGGVIPDHLKVIAKQLAACFGELSAQLNQIAESIEEALENPNFPIPRVDLEQYYQATGQWQGRGEGICRLWVALASEDPEGEPPLARWVSRDTSGDIRVCAAPVSSAETLVENLWKRCYGAVLTSATLRSLGDFDRFMLDTGIPADSRTLAVPGVFDYPNRGVLAIPNIADAGDPSAHTEALIAELPTLLNLESGGSLVLFASRRQLESVVEELDSELTERFLVQGEVSVSEIIRRHRERIDRGERSTILGLASFAEGMDLPGDYCRHVVIAKLAFPVPNDPIQAARAEWIESQGGNSFRTLSLADTCLRLIQACGRLLRTEEDSGRVTILDSRLLTKGYGRELLRALPPFRRV